MQEHDQEQYQLFDVYKLQTIVMEECNKAAAYSIFEGEAWEDLEQRLINRLLTEAKKK